MFSFNTSLRAAALFSTTTGRLLSAKKWTSQYEQEAFEASRRLQESRTYPGAIRVATPGDTRFYSGSLETILKDNERHYWRPVVDDPQVHQQVALRVRFKSSVWVTTGWETRIHAVQVLVDPDCTVSQLIEQVIIENQSPYLCTSPFTLAIEGRQLEGNKKIHEYNITEMSQIDAIEDRDHLSHLESERPKDWTIDEVTEENATHSPYKEMAMNPAPNLAPRYEARPKGYFGKNDYSGLKQ